MQMQRKQGIYEKYIKRVLDIICALLAIITFWWLYLIIAVFVRVKMGTPVIFRQLRPGMIDSKTGKERIFYMYKFRSMTNEKDEQGNLLPDDKRLPLFGKMLRATSLDELPEAFNILKGDMSVIGPRPQLIRDMVFMSDEQRMRHTAKPGLSGLAQVMGRNAITWEEKIKWDLEYIQNVSFRGDLRLVWLTFKKVFIRSEITKTNEETDVALDYGDALLKNGIISRSEYDKREIEANSIIRDYLKNGNYS